MTDDFPYYDPNTLWLLILFYILPICVNFYGCIKNKRSPIISLLVSVFYPTAIWLAIILFVGIYLFIFIQGGNLLNPPIWLGVPLSIILAFVLWPIGPVWQHVWYFYENYKHKGIFSFKNIKHKKE